MSDNDFTLAAISAQHALLLRAGSPADALAAAAVEHAQLLREALLRAAIGAADAEQAPASPTPPPADGRHALVPLTVDLAARLDAIRGDRTREQAAADALNEALPGVPVWRGALEGG